MLTGNAKTQAYYSPADSILFVLQKRFQQVMQTTKLTRGFDWRSTSLRFFIPHKGNDWDHTSAPQPSPAITEHGMP